MRYDCDEGVPLLWWWVQCQGLWKTRGHMLSKAWHCQQLRSSFQRKPPYPWWSVVLVRRLQPNKTYLQFHRRWDGNNRSPTYEIDDGADSLSGMDTADSDIGKCHILGALLPGLIFLSYCHRKLNAMWICHPVPSKSSIIPTARKPRVSSPLKDSRRCRRAVASHWKCHLIMSHGSPYVPERILNSWRSPTTHHSAKNKWIL